MDIKLNNKIVKAGGWYTITEFFLKGIAFLTIPIFTRLLTPADYGIVSLYTTWVGVFTVFIGLNLNTSIVKGKYDFKEEYDTYVSSIMFLSLLIFFGYLFLFQIFNEFFLNMTGLSIGIFYFMVFQAYFGFVRISMIVKLRAQYNYQLVSIISILISILGVILSLYLIIYVFEHKSYLGNILGNGLLIYIVGIIFLAQFIKPKSRKLCNLDYWRYALKLSVPMIPHSLSNIINAQFDRIIINQYIGESATGLYSFAYNVGMIMTVITHALDQAWSPWVYETMEKKEYDKIQYIGKIYRNIFSVAYAGLLFLSPEIIKIMADKSYWDSLNIIPYIFVGYYFIYMYTLEVKTEYFYRKTGLISVGTVLSAIINIVLNVIFVPKYGYIAAAITTTISYLFLFLFHYLITTKIIKRSIYSFRFHMTSIMYMIVTTAYYILFKNLLVMRVIGVVLLSFVLFQYLKKNEHNNK